ncbi:hypothetical protein [Leptospira interrogans]|uniref:Double-GTPase 1 domain-containing protein n=1 Tax=Leptospira interrogans str. UI 12621 TaxID=1049937 RepID=A0A0F6H7H1_LEPIR|nr:hypothetical protein [Leptospira interrogans]EKO24181.1 hypothetical protein LEP1GSC104_2111 [Leptospira interrogans str. UI 12621]OQM28464.1 hypothetical protein DV38_15660 [Leptospira interrogans]
MTYFHNIIGLPASGKTTFLAALWHLIDASEGEPDLKLDKLVGDNKYLNTIVEYWRKCQKVPRTSQQIETELLIHLHQEKKNRKITLGFSDLSGEAFDSQVFRRKCKNTYIENFNKDGGILFFITANKIEDGLASRNFSELTKNDENEFETVNWKPEFIPADVKQVELLQFLQKPPFLRRRRRMAVLISAWDVITHSIVPEKWLEREYPLFYQFINSNQDSFDFRVFGISAQGGDISHGQTENGNDIRKKLLEKIPSERIQCIGPDYKGNDLTNPICWLSEDE